MVRKLLVAATAAGVLIAGLLAPVGMGLIAATFQTVDASTGCYRVADVSPPDGLDGGQLANAEVIIQVGQTLQLGERRGLPPRAWVIAVAAALQESSLRNLVWGDADSLGLFQQRPSQKEWGTAAEILDPATAAASFYRHLDKVTGWETMPLTQAAQAVQRSADPDAYAGWEDEAVAIVAALAGVACSPGQGAIGGPVACPVAKPYSYIDSWGAPRSGGRRHQGSDLMAPYGAAVFAYASGTISRAGNAGGLGGVVIYLQGDDGTEYYYAHLSVVEVVAGQRVTVGQRIGRNGNSGNAAATAPHVHFEVHPGGDAPVNPYPYVRRACPR